ncbi:2-phospho-L-lactate transferase [Microterricola viridarii]|uniref:LPPG:FO 2-phospho-L-lactate transferase n=1 Tax=Microterricola viridarii TaxID=412690 RepID=A0A1H1N9C6_9MICO|nr:2-phospho-L-lactate transferase [Microterricola viridarii]SDR95480.1 LPPG:FO 2-phospho-L-lactate transferase [Microterricola viridarii]
MSAAPGIAVLAGGVGGSRFVRGLLHGLRAEWPAAAGSPEEGMPGSGTAASVTVIANTGDDLWLAGLRVCPDLDSIMYALGGANDEERGWGRRGESERVSAELTAYGVGWPWFTLGDLDLGTHIARSSWLRDGLPLSEATARLCARWNPGVTLLPATDDEAETLVTVADEAGGTRQLHFEEWWVRHRAALPALAFTQNNVERARPAPGVLEAIAEADVVLFAPSNPVVSIGTILGIPGIADAVRQTAAPVVGISPIIGGAVVRGMADACLSAIGVETSAVAVGAHYGARGLPSAGLLGAGLPGAGLLGADLPGAGLLDGWLVDSTDAAAAESAAGGPLAGIRTLARPLWFHTVEETAAIAADALALAARSRP